MRNRKNRPTVTLNGVNIAELRKYFGKGRIASVEFIKKTDGKIRMLNGKTKVIKGLRGGENKLKGNQLAVFDVNIKDEKGNRVGGYRAVTADNVLSIRANGKIYNVQNVHPEVSWLGDSSFNGSEKTFDIFLNGVQYRYFDVTAQEANDYYHAANRVDYFNNVIKAKHRYLRLGK